MKGGIMLYSILGSVVLLGVVIALFAHGSKDCETSNTVATVFAVIFSVMLGLFLIVFVIVASEWKASEYKVSILNKKYGTDYTREEYFYGSGVMEEIKNIDRKRIEINGDIMKGEE